MKTLILHHPKASFFVLLSAVILTVLLHNPDADFSGITERLTAHNVEPIHFNTTKELADRMTKADIFVTQVMEQWSGNLSTEITETFDRQFVTTEIQTIIDQLPVVTMTLQQIENNPGYDDHDDWPGYISNATAQIGTVITALKNVKTDTDYRALEIEYRKVAAFNAEIRTYCDNLQFVDKEKYKEVLGEVFLGLSTYQTALQEYVLSYTTAKSRIRDRESASSSE